MKNFVFLWISLVAYTILSFILLLRDEWAIKTIANFYPNVSPTLENARNFALGHHLNTIPTLFYLLITVSAFYFYWKIIKGKWINKLNTKKIILLSLFLQLTLYVSYPALSTDVFDYIMLNRVAFVYHENPWITPAINFINDPFINLGSWQRISSVYGITHHLLASIPAIIGGNDLIKSLMSMKLLMISFLTVSLIILSRSQQLKNKENLKTLALVAFNPLLLIETAGNSHNDILMVVFMLASFLALKRDKYFLSGLLLALGTQVKLYAIILVPIYLKLLTSTKRVKQTLVMLFGFSITLAIGVWSMGIESLMSQFQLFKWVFTLRLNSLSDLFNFFPNSFFVVPFLFIFLFFLLKVKEISDVISSYLAITLIYLLFIIPMYFSWYVIWYLPFLGLIKFSKMSIVGIVFSLSSLMYYGTLMTALRFNRQHGIWPLTFYVVLVIPSIVTYRYLQHAKKT